MQEVFEKIIEKLEEYEYENLVEHDSEMANHCKKDCNDVNDCTLCVWDKAIEIVKQEAEKFGTDTNVWSNGWIPVSERLPKEPEEGLTDLDECDEYIVMIENADIPTALNYVGDGEWYRDGEFYNIIAWQPLPQPYHQKGEING